MLFCLFDTPLGTCALAWNDIGIVGVNLPESNQTTLRKRMRERYAGSKEHAPPAHIGKIIRNITALLSGKKVDLSSVPLDMSGLPAFHQRVYEVVSKIPVGQTLSYGDVAKRLKKPGAARAIGQAMGRNPFPILVPCHRVLAANGKLGGFTSFGGTNTKERMLVIEGHALPTVANKQNSNKQNANKKIANKKVVVTPAAKSAKTVSTSKAKPSRSAFSARKAVQHLRERDPVLGKWMDRAGPYRLQVDPLSDVFMALARTIVYQQLHGKAAATIFRRVCELFAPSGEVSSAAFTASDIRRCADDKLRGAGLSRNKLLAMRDLADKANSGALPDMAALQQMEDEAVIDALTTVRGIGRWTVQMLLMFRLGRPDVLPVDDFGVRKGFMLAYGQSRMPTPKELLAHGERWAPYRSVASWYLWRAADMDKAALNRD